MFLRKIVLRTTSPLRSMNSANNLNNDVGRIMLLKLVSDTYFGAIDVKFTGLKRYPRLEGFSFTMGFHPRYHDEVLASEEIRQGLEFPSSCSSLSESASSFPSGWFWDLNGDGGFQVKDVSIYLDEAFLLQLGSFRTRWIKSIPIKKSGDIIVQQFRLSDNLADLFTKALPTTTFKKLVHGIGMRRLEELK
ncbi:hypothetical protein Tco_0870004 [Tanacetum coccineum]